MRLIITFILLFSVTTKLQAQVSEVNLNNFLKYDSIYSAQHDAAFKAIIIQLNRALAITAANLSTATQSLNAANKRQDSIKLSTDKLMAAKNKSQDSLIALLQKKRTQDSIAYQHDIIAGKKDQLAIKQTGTKPPYKFEFGFDQVFTDDYAAVKKAYDALKKRMDAYDASKPAKTITIQVQ